MATQDSRGRWRLWPCVALALLLPAVFASAARADVEEFSNPNPIAVPGTVAAGVQKGNPYPSIIRLSGFTGNVTKVRVTLNNFAHTFPDDIDVLLVGPGNQSAVLMSDAGGGGAINVDLTFDDAATGSLPDVAGITSGTFKPTNHAPDPDTFPAPAPAAPFGTTLGVFNGILPNGDWKLYAVDDVGSVDSGMISDGWELEITTPVAETPEGEAPTGAGETALRSGRCANPQRGTNGRDVLNGTSFGDRLRGRGGNDVLRGRRGSDCLYGDSGRDRLSGDSGRDRLSGGSGRDRLSGGSGGDRLSGGSGNDRIKGGSGRNRYSGGSGNDSINSRNGRSETVRCGSGSRDSVRADSSDRLRGCERVRL